MVQCQIIARAKTAIKDSVIDYSSIHLYVKPKSYSESGGTAAMGHAITLDFLLISTSLNPHLADVQSRLNELRLGVTRIQEPPVDADLDLRPSHERVEVGRISVHETLARIDAIIVFERHLHPPMHGLAPSALDAMLAQLDLRWQPILRTGTMSIDIHFSSAEPDAFWRMTWIHSCVSSVANILEAVVFDPATQRCLSAESFTKLSSKSIIDHIAFHNEPWGPELRWIHTHGLQKFGQPELELVAVPQSLEYEANNVLCTITESLALTDSTTGPGLRPGMQVECEGSGHLFARSAPTDQEHSAPYGRLRLVTSPQPGLSPTDNVDEVLVATALELARESLEKHNWLSARRYIDHALTAIPEHPGAIAMQAKYYLDQGQPQEALDAGNYLTLRNPDDWHGPYITGVALYAMGRMIEALHALDRAEVLQPNEAAIFESRSFVNERLNRVQESKADRIKARMLRR
jgi:hypothetical protein